MVKTPKTRHSRPPREPVTIELEPGEVSRAPTPSSPRATTEIFDLAPPPGATPDESAAVPPQAAVEAEDAGSPAAAAEPPTEAAVADESPPGAEAAAPVPEPGPARFDEPEPAPKMADSKPLGYDFEPGAAASRNTEAAAAKEPPIPTPPPTPNPPAARSRIGALAAGIIGGVVALAGGGLLQLSGILGTPGSGGLAPGLDVVEDIAALKTEIAALKQSGPANPEIAGRVDGLAQALDQVKANVASLQEAIAAGGAGENAGLQALDARVKQLETDIAGLSQGGNGPSPEELAALNQTVTALSERIAGVEALAKSGGEADTAIDGRLGALEQSLSALTARVDAQAAQPKIALAIAAAALKSAIERGVPFQAEIETFAAVAPDAPELAALRSYAEKGVATRADILAETDAAANAIIAAANPPSADAGFFERLLASAESLVSVRPIGEVEGPGVPETVARMEVAIKAGDLAKAIAEFDTLPDAAKAAGAAFGDKVRARLEVERLADQAIASAMKA
jgi:hypothetical protein